ncbi:MAG TPA: type II secretion system F family protein [Opitutaceae bacterium]|nr:type II secretion system F family protein [Opitutaceae bacterium]
MPRYTYAAIDTATGRESAGELDRADAEAAIADLKARGLFPTDLRPADTPAGAAPDRRPGSPARTLLGSRVPRFRRKAGARELAIFTRQLSALVNAGMPLVRGLELLARQERNPGWQSVIASLADAIRSGGTLSDGLARHPKIFDRLYIGMVRAGESGGRPEVVLERLARHLEKAGRLKARVKAAMTYPVIIMAVAVGIMAGLMVFVVPRFEKIFAGVLKGAPLPALTQAVLGVSRQLQEHGLAALAALAALVVAGQWLRRTDAGAHAVDQVLLRLPGFGGLVLKAAIARFSRTLGTMLTSGVPILAALQLTRDTCGSRVVAGVIGTVHRCVREGEGVARPLAATGVFPPMVTGMIEVGEETGTLPDMLTRVAELYEDEVDTAVASLTSLIEPLMIVLMAVIVGVVVIALFLPIVRIIQLMS